jgi:uncharacterized protein (UPF0332 family)
VPLDWLEYYNLAIELARRPEEAYLRTAISRAYYCVYHLGLQRAEANDFTPIRGESTHNQLWRIFKGSPEYACRQLGEIAMRLKEKRERADYRDVFPRVADEVPNVLADTQAFVEGLRRLPARHPDPKSVRI